MPRPPKRGLDYFPLDVGFFSEDDKIRILRARYGTDGIIVYLYLLCEIYKKGYYLKWSEDNKFLLADALNLTDGFIEQVLTFLLERSLLDSTLFKSDTILTSPGIQRRYQLAVKERAKKTPIEIKGFWLLDEAETEPFIKVYPAADNSGKNKHNSGKNPDNSREVSIKESKEKKRKENKNHRLSAYAADPRLDRAIADFVDFRKKIRKPMTDRAVELMLHKLEELSTDPAEQAEILNQSIRNGWTGVYPIKDHEKQEGAAPVKPKPNQFHNFHQRDTDYDALVMDQLKERLKKEGENTDE